MSARFRKLLKYDREMASMDTRHLSKTQIGDDCYAEFRNGALIINRTDHSTWIALTEEQWLGLVEFMEDLEFRCKYE